MKMLLRAVIATALILGSIGVFADGRKQPPQPPVPGGGMPGPCCSQ